MLFGQLHESFDFFDSLRFGEQENMGENMEHGDREHGGNMGTDGEHGDRRDVHRFFD
jgi:hypothetical protein